MYIIIVITGYFKNSLKEGLGQLYLVNSKIYIIGKFNNNSLNGIGLVIEEYGNEKLLNFKNNKPIGKAILDHNNSDIKQNNHYIKFKAFYINSLM